MRAKLARNSARRCGAAILFVALASGTSGATGAVPLLHEPIPPDPGEDLAMHVLLDGNLPAAIQTQRGAVGAPDPQALPGASDPTYGAASNHDQFQPDRDTSRPQVNGYDDPFTPSTAPFKRLAAFDAVRDDYTLYVRDGQLVPLPLGSTPGADEDIFFADAVVDFEPDQHVRIPSVGPGAHVMRAHLGIGTQDLAFRIARDGADNWFLDAANTGHSVQSTKGEARARLVMELSIPRAAFGGALTDSSWNDLPFVARLPENVARDAAVVASAIGVSRRLRPRQAIAMLVRYFREFVDSTESPHAHGNVYLDLALSKKGVCRHRAFAFLVTAQSLGIPTRMVINDAHAWVEIHDGTLWRRLDLGGAGEFADTSVAEGERVHYDPPPDTFSWPAGAERGDRIMERARSAAATGATAAAPVPSRAATAGTAQAVPSWTSDADAIAEDPQRQRALEALAGQAPPASTVTLTLVDGEDARRGTSLRVRGTVRAAGEACPGVAVDVSLRALSGRRLYLGTLATDEDGAFTGGLIVPSTFALGDYDVIARTAGATQCGASEK